MNYLTFNTNTLGKIVGSYIHCECNNKILLEDNVLVYICTQCHNKYRYVKNELFLYRFNLETSLYKRNGEKIMPAKFILPRYGDYVLVYGVNKKIYGNYNWHVCRMDDLEDGADYSNKGDFYWITESGAVIEDVKYWCELPNMEKI